MRYRQRRLESLSWRTLRIVQRIFTRGYVKRQKAYRVDLGLLQEAGVLKRRVCDELRAWTDRAIPATVWIGHDYSDPRSQNFL